MVRYKVIDRSPQFPRVGLEVQLMSDSFETALDYPLIYGTLHNIEARRCKGVISKFCIDFLIALDVSFY